MRSVPTLLSPLLANIALNGIEDIHQTEGKIGTKRGMVSQIARYADDMVIILKPKDNAQTILDKISQFLADRGMNISQKKTKLTATTDGFDFLGWHFKVQTNGKFRCIPSTDNFKKFRKKVKAIVNNSNYGAVVKAEKLAPIVRGWRNYHRYCKMEGSRLSLIHIQQRAYRVFNKETKQTRHTSKKLLDKAFPTVPYSENKHVNVKGEKSPFDGDLTYWSERNSKLYDGETSKALKRQNHTCVACGLKFLTDERVHLHHVDANHANWKKNNLIAIHESCHDHLHMGKRESQEHREPDAPKGRTSGSKREVRRIIPPIDSTKPSGSRIERGLYKTARGFLINADCNGAANILAKVATQLGVSLVEVVRGALTLPQRIDLFTRLNKSYRKRCVDGLLTLAATTV